MASDPMTSWQIEGEKVEVMTDFLLLASKITADGDCSQEIRRQFLLRRKALTNLDSLLKSRGIPDRSPYSQGYGLPSGHLHLRLCDLDCKEGRVPKKMIPWNSGAGGLLRFPWTAKRSNQLILRKINPEYSLEGLMLKLSSSILVTWCKQLTC